MSVDTQSDQRPTKKVHRTAIQSGYDNCFFVDMQQYTNLKIRSDVKIKTLPEPERKNSIEPQPDSNTSKKFHRTAILSEHDKNCLSRQETQT